MANSKKDVCIDEFLNAVSSTLESKYILIDRKISDILYSIANTRDVYNVIAKCMINFDFIQAWGGAVKSNFIKLPDNEDDRIAFIFCFLSNIDDKNLEAMDLKAKCHLMSENFEEAFRIYQSLLSQ